MKRLSTLAFCALVAACAHEEAPARDPLSPTTFVDVTPSPSAAPPRETPDAPFRVSGPGLPAPAPFTPPEIRAFHLKNGVRVLFLARPAPSLFRIELVLQTPPGAPIGANALALNGLWLGSSAHTEAQLAATRDASHAIWNGWSSGRRSGAMLTAFADRASEAITLLAEVTLTPTFPAGPVLRANVMIMHRLEQVVETPSMLARRLLPMALHGWDHPDDTWGELRSTDVGALVRDDLVRAWTAAADPANATLLVVGDTTEAELRPLLERGFGAWRGHGAKPAAPARTSPVVPGSPRLVVVDRPHSPETFVLAGGVAPAFGTDDRAAEEVVDAIFGGTTGRATRALRDERHLLWSYEPPLGRDDGVEPRWTWSGGFASERTAEGLRELEHQMRALAASPVSETELAEAQGRLVRQAPSWLTTIDGEGEMLRVIAARDLPLDFPARRLAREAVVTAVDVQRVAREYLDPDRLRFILVGDWSALQPQLVSLGWGPIEIRDASGKILRVEQGTGAR